jgi:ABC-type oligopeptide transport system ATPase subunit
MTDIIKDFEQKISGKVISYLKNNKQFEKENVEMFLQELADIGANNPTLIAFGNDSHNILKRNFHHKFKILKVPHYSIYISKEKYREQVKEILEIKGLERK